MMTELTKDGRPKTAGDSCSARRVGYRKSESQNSRRGVGKSEVGVDAVIHLVMFRATVI